MNIVVCVKRVPQTQEVDLTVDESKKDIRKDSLAYFINEWDNYAIEEAILLKEKSGGEVTAVTIGSEDDEEVAPGDRAGLRCRAGGHGHRNSSNIST